ncbi:hypothetical protein KC887_02070 [Candidatus Kaiserbacteria bacterium]|nr:hypothetical protein [Candidatus Kaiserbacteria bacterium]
MFTPTLTPFTKALQGKITSEDQLAEVLALRTVTDIETADEVYYQPGPFKHHNFVQRLRMNLPTPAIGYLAAPFATPLIPVPEVHTWAYVREALRMVYLRQKRLPLNIVFPNVPELPGLGYVTEDGLIGYTESWDKALRDIQTVIRPGRYIKKVNPDYTDKQVMDIVHTLNDSELSIHTTWDDPKEWRRVYEHGPQSCMGRKTPDSFGLGREDIHPVEVYARENNGIGLMWVENAHGVIGARTIITDDDKYVRLYVSDYLPSAGPFLKDHLDAEGIHHFECALDGRELERIEARDGRLICPFIDGDNRVRDDDDYLTAGYGDLIPDHASGRVDDESMRSCDCCGGRTHEDDLRYSERHDQHICEYCADSDYVYAIVNYRGHTHTDLIRYHDAIEVNGEHYLDDSDVLYHHGFRAVDGEWFPEDEVVYDELNDEDIHTNDAVELTCGIHQGKWTHTRNVLETHDGGHIADDDPELVTLISGDYASLDECRIHGGEYYLITDLQEELDLEDAA